MAVRHGWHSSVTGRKLKDVRSRLVDCQKSTSMPVLSMYAPEIIYITDNCLTIYELLSLLETRFILKEEILW